MTVCVAAIYDGNSVIGASDRMLTAGDIQFQPQQTKIIPVTTSIAIMIAGDSAMQSEIMQGVLADVNRRLTAEPTKWLFVREIANFYRVHYNVVRHRKAENDILFPIGLNRATFVSQQKNMDPSLVRQVATELINFETPDVDAIFAGDLPPLKRSSW